MLRRIIFFSGLFLVCLLFGQFASHASSSGKIVLEKAGQPAAQKFQSSAPTSMQGAIDAMQAKAKTISRRLASRLQAVGARDRKGLEEAARTAGSGSRSFVGSYGSGRPGIQGSHPG